MKTYLNALDHVLKHGTTRADRTGTGTISVFGMQQRYDLSLSFPAMTTKKLAWKSVVSELLWFIEGSGDERRLAEILHGTRDAGKKTIWTDNAGAEYWRPKAKFDGDLGRVYGVQWRHWQTTDTEYLRNADGKELVRNKEVDQLQDMALPPCHCFAQFYVSDGRLSCQMYQRSCDMFLGVPFNIASYSLLTHLIAQVCNLEVGEFVHVLGDAHIYLNHVEQVKEQCQREPLPAPQLWLNPDITDITKFTMDDIRLDGYTSHSAISAPMAV
jgi:thymidylate synthase